VPLTGNGLDWQNYKESRTVPSEAEAEGNETKQQARAEAVSDGKLTPEVFDQGFNATRKPFTKPGWGNWTPAWSRRSG